MLFGGMAHRRAENVSKQVDELGEAIEAVEGQLREAEARPSRPPVPGMPLPTGYGLQVRGPDDESIVLPVCLPPGFELASMVLCPEFLPRDQPAARARGGPPRRRRRPRPPRSPPPAPAAIRERLSGTLQYVFGNDPGFSVDETFGGAVAAEEPRPSAPRHRDPPPLRSTAAGAALAAPGVAASAGRRARAFLRVRSARCSARSRSHSRGDCSPLRQERSALAQVLKLERSPIEAIRVDPTPNHDRGRLDRHDSALFSPRCSAPCLRRGRGALPRPHERAGARRGRRRRAGASCATSASSPHPGGRVVARWNGRDAAGKVAPDGSYRLKVSLSGRRIELLNPLALDTTVRLLGTNVSRRVISPDCDAYGDRVTVVVRGREQLAGVQLRGAQGRPARAHRARGTPRAGARGQLAALRRQALHDRARRPLPRCA